MQQKSPRFEPLTKVYGSSFCKYSVIENKLEALYKNQEIIYELLKRVIIKIGA